MNLLHEQLIRELNEFGITFYTNFYLTYQGKKHKCRLIEDGLYEFAIIDKPYTYQLADERLTEIILYEECTIERTN